MAEQLSDLTLTNEQLATVASIGRDAVATVDEKYGTGFPHFQGGRRSLAYHNGYHARSVAEDAVRVGRALGLTVVERVTVEVAGYAHDVDVEGPRGDIERRSAEWLTEQMRRQGLPASVAEAAALAILGTEPVFEDGKLVGQVATQLDYPSESAERVVLSVACGDFGRMLQPIGPLLSDRLYQQINGAAPDQAPPMDNFVQFLTRQIELRESHRFPLREADDVLGTHRRQVIEYGHMLLRLHERGDVVTWNQVMAADRAFMNNPYMGEASLLLAVRDDDVSRCGQ